MSLSVLAAVGAGFSATLAAFLIFAVLQGIAQIDRLDRNLQGHELLVFVTRTRPSSRLVVHTLHSWSDCRRRTAGWLMDRFAQSPAPGSAIAPYRPALLGPAAVLSLILILMYLCLRNRPEDVGLPPIEQYHDEVPSVAAESPPQAAAVPPSFVNGGNTWITIREVLAAPQRVAAGDCIFSNQVSPVLVLFLGSKVCGRKPRHHGLHEQLHCRMDANRRCRGRHPQWLYKRQTIWGADGHR